MSLRAAGLILAALLLSGGTLDGRLVTFTVMTWDDPAHPLLAARGRTVEVGTGVEFGLGPEGLTGGLDVVPVTVQIGPSRLDLSYPPDAGSGQFFRAGFNGYVLRFEVECVLFEGIEVDALASTMPLTDAEIWTDGRALFINVSGQDYGPAARLGLALSVTDCPLS